MSTKDNIQRFIFDNINARGELVSLNKSFTDLTDTANYPPVVRNLLGEFAAAVVMLRSIIKIDGRMSLQLQGDGPLKLIMAECDEHQHFRGIARFEEEDVSKLLSFDEETPISELIGQAKFAITIFPKSGQHYQGVVPTEGECLADFLMHYFKQSEQLDTFIKLSAEGDLASGILLQVLPETEIVEADEDGWDRIVHLTRTLTDEELHNLDNERILNSLFHEEDVRLYPEEAVKFQCTCSRERTEEAIKSMGYEQVAGLLEESQEPITVDCHFCHASYAFSADDVEALFGKKKDDKPSVLH